MFTAHPQQCFNTGKFWWRRLKLWRMMMNISAIHSIGSSSFFHYCPVNRKLCLYIDAKERVIRLWWWQSSTSNQGIQTSLLFTLLLQSEVTSSRTFLRLRVTSSLVVYSSLALYVSRWVMMYPGMTRHPSEMTVRPVNCSWRKMAHILCKI